jgi:hypothetical protein
MKEKRKIRLRMEYSITEVINLTSKLNDGCGILGTYERWRKKPDVKRTRAFGSSGCRVWPGVEDVQKHRCVLSYWKQAGGIIALIRMSCSRWDVSCDSCILFVSDSHLDVIAVFISICTDVLRIVQENGWKHQTVRFDWTLALLFRDFRSPAWGTEYSDNVIYWCKYVVDFLVQSQKQKATTSVMSVRPSVRMEQLGSHWTHFHAIWYLGIFRKSVEKIKVSFWSD